jgi:hypothetical protein
MNKQQSLGRNLGVAPGQLFQVAWTVGGASSPSITENVKDNML